MFLHQINILTDKAALDMLEANVLRSPITNTRFDKLHYRQILILNDHLRHLQIKSFQP